MEARQVRTILDCVPALCAILDTDQRYRFANRQHAVWLGEDPDAVIGRHVGDVLGQQAFDVLALHCLESSGEGLCYTGELSFGRGGERFVYATCGHLDPISGWDDALLLVITDMSEVIRTREALGASMQRSQTILDVAVDAIIIIDETGIIQSCNASIESLFGYTAAEVVGTNVKILMPPEYAEAHDGYLDYYRQTGDKRIIGIGREVIAQRKDGSRFPAHLAVGESTTRGRRYFTGFVRDLTKQKQAEESARRHLEELSHITRVNAIDHLAAGIAHEVNQPLTAIVTMSQAMLRAHRAGRLDNDVLVDTLERIVSQGGRANAIIQEMRELVRKSKRIELSKHTVDEIIKAVMALLEYELRSEEVSVVMALDDALAPVRVSKIQIEQVLINLIQNAIHAMQGSREKTLTIKSRCTDDHSVEVEVRDTGIGLPKGEGVDVFADFFTTKKEGLGQGLSISRSIIEWHGGKIETLEMEMGAAFRFTLPLSVTDE